MPDRLTPAARAWAIERILDHGEDRWIENLIRAAASEDDAVALLRHEMGWSGYGDSEGYRWHAMYEHVDVAYPDGSAGELAWRDVVRAARADAVQGVLL